MESVHRRGVAEPYDRYYFIRAREYIQNNRDCKLTEHAPERVAEFFKAIGRNNRLQDWQCRQAVFAIQILFEEAKRLFQELDGIWEIMAGLLYGSGMRLMECVRLRVNDIDFDCGHIMIRDARGQKDRTVPMCRYCAA